MHLDFKNIFFSFQTGTAHYVPYTTGAVTKPARCANSQGNLLPVWTLTSVHPLILVLLSEWVGLSDIVVCLQWCVYICVDVGGVRKGYKAIGTWTHDLPTAMWTLWPLRHSSGNITWVQCTGYVFVKYPTLRGINKWWLDGRTGNVTW